MGSLLFIFFLPAQSLIPGFLSKLCDMSLELETFLDPSLKLLFFILDPLVGNPYLPVQITGFLFQFCSDFLQAPSWICFSMMVEFLSRVLIFSLVFWIRKRTWEAGPTLPAVFHIHIIRREKRLCGVSRFLICSRSFSSSPSRVLFFLSACSSWTLKAFFPIKGTEKISVLWRWRLCSGISYIPW